MTEEERKHYNKKLIKEGFSGEIKKPKSFSWDLVTTFLGCKLGNVLDSIFGINDRLSGLPGAIVSILIITVSITIVKFAALGLSKLRSKSNDTL